MDIGTSEALKSLFGSLGSMSIKSAISNLNCLFNRKVFAVGYSFQFEEYVIQEIYINNIYINDKDIYLVTNDKVMFSIGDFNDKLFLSRDEAESRGSELEDSIEEIQEA